MANAWATILGAIVLWFVAESLGYQVIIPDSMPEAITLTVLCLVSAWGVIFVVRLLSAPARVYALLQGENAELAAELGHFRQQQAALEIGELSTSHIENWSFWRVLILNHGPAVAENIIVRLVSIAPQPEEVVGALEFPLTLDGAERINAGSDAHFEVLRAYRDQSCWRISSFGRSTAFAPQIVVKNGRFEFVYHVHGANTTAPIAFTFVVTTSQNGLEVAKK